LSVRGVIALAVSDITPMASLLIIAPVVLAASGTGSMWAYLIGCFLAICVALCMGELGSMYPVAGGLYSIVGYGGQVTIEHLDMINRELTIQGNQVGTYTDLVELMELDRRGVIHIESKLFPLAHANDAIEELRAGRILGRAVLVP